MPKGKKHNVIIGLGSNIEPEDNTRKAKGLLAQFVKILAESRFLKTKPYGKKDQPDFLNGAILVETSQSREDLNKILKKIEKTLGRIKSVKNFGPRTIDLDILIWDDEIINKDFYDRDFVRASVLELNPLLKF